MAENVDTLMPEQSRLLREWATELRHDMDRGFHNGTCIDLRAEHIEQKSGNDQ